MDNINNCSISKNFTPGLLHGDAGMAIVFHLLAAVKEDHEAFNTAAALLDRISEHIGSVRGLEYENGLAGIGWAIEWLVQANLLKGVNTDEILPEVDDILYREVTTAKASSISIKSGAMGKAAYFLKRARSKNEGTHRYLQLCHQECLVMLTDDIDEIIKGLDVTISMWSSWDKETADSPVLRHLVDLGTYSWMFAQSIKINEPVIEDALFENMTFIGSTLDSLLLQSELLKTNRDLYWHLFYVAICYQFAANFHGHHYWLEKAEAYQASFHAIGGDIGQETTPNLFRLLSVYSLLNTYYPLAKYRTKLEQAIGKLKSAEQPNTLYQGRGSIILAELCIDRPDLINSWHELFFI